MANQKQVERNILYDYLSGRRGFYIMQRGSTGLRGVSMLII
jgi:hypothetical protein